MKQRILAVVPAKDCSRRLPGKNLKLLDGRPLLEFSLEQARRSRLIDQLVVSTESPVIRDYCQDRGVSVPFLRPPEQSADDVHASVPVLDTLERLGGARVYSHCVMLLPTSPLRTAAAIDEAIELSLEHETNVVSVAPLGKSLQHLRSLDENGRLENVVPVPHANFQSQDVPELLVLNGSIYCAPSADLLRHRSFHYGRPLAYLMKREESVDVDVSSDLRLAEYFLHARSQACAS